MLKSKSLKIRVLLCLIMIGVIVFPLNSPNLAQSDDKDICYRFLTTLKEDYKKCFNADITEQFTARQQDELGITSLEDEWARAFAFKVSLSNKPESQAFIVVYGGKVNKIGEIKERTDRIVDHMTQTLRIPKERITVVNGGFKEEFQFQFWLSPSKDIFPPLAPTVDVEKVRFRGKMKPLPRDLDYPTPKK